MFRAAPTARARGPALTREEGVYKTIMEPEDQQCDGSTQPQWASLLVPQRPVAWLAGYKSHMESPEEATQPWKRSKVEDKYFPASKPTVIFLRRPAKNWWYRNKPHITVNSRQGTKGNLIGEKELCSLLFGFGAGVWTSCVLSKHPTTELHPCPSVFTFYLDMGPY